MYVSPVESAALGVCGNSNWFRTKPWIPSLVGHLPRVKLRLSSRSVAEGKMMRVMMEWGETGGSARDFPAFAL